VIKTSKALPPFHAAESPSPMLWILLIAVVYALHQDLWFWRAPRPLLFGFLPPGLWFHALYCLVVAVLMWALTRKAWPSHLDRNLE
jgi:hypothetical protein